MERPSEYAAPADRAWARSAVLTPLFALIALIAGTMSSFSLSSNFLVLSTGGSLFYLGMSNGAPHVEPLSRLPSSAGWWIVPIGVLLVTEAVTFLIGSSLNYPTLSRLADPVLERQAARSAMFFGWISAFWGLARR